MAKWVSHYSCPMHINPPASVLERAPFGGCQSVPSRRGRRDFAYQAAIFHIQHCQPSLRGGHAQDIAGKDQSGHGSFLG